jgi:DNA-binding LytR/AlgR family response regulator
MNCLIVDDEQLAVDVIKEHVSRIPYLNLIGETNSAFEAIEILDNASVDLIFLDIQMPELTGIELLNSLSKKPLVIFTTAYPEYALESYEYNAVDYLVKPVSFERLLKAVNKAKNRLLKEKSDTLDLSSVKDEKDYIFVKTEYKTVRIDVSDIHYVESNKDYVTFHLSNEKVTSLLTLSAVSENLPNSRFIRIHRSFIVAINKITEIERNTIIVNADRLQVGSSYRDAFKKTVNEHRLI